MNTLSNYELRIVNCARLPDGGRNSKFALGVVG